MNLLAARTCLHAGAIHNHRDRVLAVIIRISTCTHDSPSVYALNSGDEKEDVRVIKFMHCSFDSMHVLKSAAPPPPTKLRRIHFNIFLPGFFFWGGGGGLAKF